MARRIGDEGGEGDDRVVPFVRPPASVSVEVATEVWHEPGFVISDANLAECFLSRRGEDFCYSRQRKVWRSFSGARWEDDALLLIHRAIGDLLDEIGEVTARKIRDKMHIGSRKTTVAVEGVLRAALAVNEAVFDADPWLLNTPDGTIDLRMREGVGPVLRKHDRADYLTKMTVTSPNGECPLWLDHIDAVTVGDRELGLYLQRLFGYGLVGVTSEQMLAYLYGTGGNGKGALVGALLHVLGDYGVTVSSEVFASQQVRQHSEELMVLRGARLIISSETESGHSWNESRIKQLTGGDRIRARYMRENSVEFEISGLICILANHLLELQNVDDAIKRRLHMVPFAAKFEGEAVDRGIGDKLKLEAGGILKWLLEGCRMWQAEGLAAPAAVDAATDEYLAGEDHVKEFTEERLITHQYATMSTKTSDLYAAWKTWADARGHKVGGINAFSRNMVRLGFEKSKGHNKARSFVRVAIKE